jgi:Cu+-exporting ATPase
MAMAVDPVCGMKVHESRAPAKTQHQGRTYSFCSLDCKRAFEAQPKVFVETTRISTRVLFKLQALPIG